MTALLPAFSNNIRSEDLKMPLKILSMSALPKRLPQGSRPTRLIGSRDISLTERTRHGWPQMATFGACVGTA